MGMRRESFRQKYPVMDAYGGHHEFLEADEAIGATVAERIRSIWPFIVRRVVTFQGGLKPRERVSFDAEDTLVQLWVALAERDGKWAPDRGKYITFAGAIIDCELCSIRDKARTVEAPRNTSCRLKEYEAEEEAGTITARRRKTAADIRRTAGGIHSIGDDGCDLGRTVTVGTLAEIIEREEADVRMGGLKEAVGRLSPLEADVLVRTAGIFGHEAGGAREVAEVVGLDVREARKVRDRARAKLRKFLLAHPAAQAAL